MSKKLVILGTGGTIAGVAEHPLHHVAYKAAQLDVAQLLAQVPTAGTAAYTVHTEQVFQCDSKDMDFSHWLQLAQRVQHYLQCDDVAGVVITHGTDTLEESAFFLSQVMPARILACKPVVFTCAMRPATSLQSDGPQNLFDALVVASSPGACGVLVVCGGSLHLAKYVQKTHTYRLDAFDSGDAGALGVIEEGQLRLMYHWPAPDLHAPPHDLQHLASTTWPRVEIILSYAGVHPATVMALCAPPEAGVPPVQGLIVAGTGNGTLHHHLEAALLQVQAQGVSVLRCSRCARGRVVQQSGATSLIQPAADLSVVKARIALMLSLMQM